LVVPVVVFSRSSLRFDGMSCTIYNNVLPYMRPVWQNGVRTAHQPENADKEDLVAAGVTSAIHANDIKARAQQATGTHSFTTMYGLRSYKACGLIIARRVSANSRLASGESCVSSLLSNGTSKGNSSSTIAFQLLTPYILKDFVKIWYYGIRN
jgi:hypothetical protein